MDAIYMVLHKREKEITNIIFFKDDRVISFFQSVFGILLMLALTQGCIGPGVWLNLQHQSSRGLLLL